MSLIRGVKGLFPCPICLVPQHELSDLSKTYPLRTQEHSEAIFKQAETMKRKGDKEKLLKRYSLRNVKVYLFYLQTETRLTYSI